MVSCLLIRSPLLARLYPKLNPMKIIKQPLVAIGRGDRRAIAAGYAIPCILSPHRLYEKKTSGFRGPVTRDTYDLALPHITFWSCIAMKREGYARTLRRFVIKTNGPVAYHSWG